MWQEKVIKYIGSLSLDEPKYALFEGGDESLYACCFAIMTKHYLNKLEDIDSQKYIDYINSFQDENSGFFIGPETKENELTSKHSWEHVLMHLTCHVLPTILLLRGKPKYKFTFLDAFKDTNWLKHWLDQRDFRDAWYEGNYLLFVGELLAFETEQGDKKAKDALNYWFEWLDNKVDPMTGLWGTQGFCNPYMAIFGAYHQFLVYYYFNRPIKYYEKVIDTTLNCSNAIGSGACEDVDIIDILVNARKRTDYRCNDIELVLKRAVGPVLACQNEDGGFTYAQRNQPFSMMGIKRTAYPMPNSHMFPTWFRVHTLALLNEIINDPRISNFNYSFNSFCSMGWHDTSLKPKPKKTKGQTTNGAQEDKISHIEINDLANKPNTMAPEYTEYKGERVSLNRKAIMQFLEAWAPRIKGSVLDVGAGNWKYPKTLFQHCNYISSDISKEFFNVDIVLDILNPPTEHFGKYDAVIATDLLEHVKEPIQAVKGLFDVLKEKGTLLLTTPFNYELHADAYVKDYWRITEQGLELLLRKAGFADIDINAIGNKKAPLVYCVVAKKPVFPKKTEPILFNQGEGSIGGPSVKLSRLNKYFKTDSELFNIVYTVSTQVPVDYCWQLQRKGKKIVYNCPGVLIPAYRPNYALLNQPLKLLHKFADFVIYQSQFSKKGAEKYLGAREKPNEVLYNAVDTKLFKYFTRPKDRCNILVAGNIYIRHRLEPLIRAFPLIKQETPQAKLIIAGPLASLPGGKGDVFQSSFREIKAIAESVGVDFKYIPQYSQEEAPEIYAQGDVFVHLKHLDWCPNVVLEAMSAGLPIVHAGNGGTKEIVGEGGISLDLPENWDEIPHIDENKLAEKIIECFNKKSKIGEKAREIAESKFKIEHWVEKHKQIFYQLLD